MSEQPGQFESPLSFEEQSNRYFTAFALRQRDLFPLLQKHGVAGQSSKQSGEFPIRDETSDKVFTRTLQPDWGNVGKHCLVEAVEADVLAEALKLSDAERKELVGAAFLHDFGKRDEKTEMRKANEGDYLETEERVEQEAKETMRVFLETRGYPPEKAARMAMIAGAAGDLHSVGRMEDEDVTLAEKIMQYVDGITKNTDIATVAERVAQNRVAYADLDTAWLALKGETYTDAQERVLINIEQELATRVGLEDHTQLPEWLRQRIRERIEAVGP